MRIIAGEAKGRRLAAPRSGTRPFTGRAKEAVFSSLARFVPNADVLDLFAGSGSLGLEALSRGAASAVFVERDRSAAAVLSANVASVDLGGTVVTVDVDRFLETRSRDLRSCVRGPPIRVLGRRGRACTGPHWWTSCVLPDESSCTDVRGERPRSPIICGAPTGDGTVIARSGSSRRSNRDRGACPR